MREKHGGRNNIEEAKIHRFGSQVCRFLSMVLEDVTSHFGTSIFLFAKWVYIIDFQAVYQKYFDFRRNTSKDKS